MYKYYVNRNAQSTGEHEVHREGCHRMPEIYNLICLGYFSNGRLAVQEARKYFYNVDGCYYCCCEAHEK